jgi:hypothetical protein
VKQRIVPGMEVDFLTADEMVKMIRRPEQITRVRVPGNVVLTAAGGGDDEIYKVPAGMELAVRRVVLTLTGNVPNDPNTGNVLLNAAGKFVAYMRSGQLIEYGQPQYGAAIQVPGVQTWGDQQGPYLRNGEVFGVVAAGLTANASLSVYVEGLLYRPASSGDEKRTP